jgi:hypothetical protein
VKRFVTAIIPPAIIMLVGGVTLLTYLWPALAGARVLLVELAVIVAAFAMLPGVVNVLHVHGTNIIRGRGRFYSLVLLFTFVIVLLLSGLDVALSANRVSGEALAQQAMSGVVMTRVYEYVLIPIQASLTALLPFFLAFAAYRTLRIRRTIGSMLGAVVFLGTAIVVLLGQAPLFRLSGLDSGLIAAREWIVRVPSMAGMRGILLGVALGIIATALRVLIGADRPSSD